MHSEHYLSREKRARIQSIRFSNFPNLNRRQPPYPTQDPIAKRWIYYRPN